MSGRVSKMRSRIKPSKTDQRDSLLSAVLSAAIPEMARCSYCEGRNLVCRLSETDSSRCSSCINSNQANCDVRGLSPEQLNRVAAQYRKLELELEAAEEEAEVVINQANAKLRRLRKQKRMWYEKMMKAVSRGVDNLEELERLEAEESRATAEAQSLGVGDAVEWSAAGFPDTVDPNFDWSVFLSGPPVVASGSGDTGQASQNSLSNS